MSDRRIAIGLGSNVGDRLASLRTAVYLLQKNGLIPEEKSDVFETPPWGKMDQPLFLNACAVFKTSLREKEILTVAKNIEKLCGRKPRDKWGPREIDIDLLLFEDRTSFSDTDLSIPHPLIAQRAFVLLPLSQIAGTWRLPPDGKSISQLLSSVDAAGITRITSLCSL